ncbi:SPOR domain-containing protein [Vibrio sp. 10N.261.51.F12]|uniref:SPOR domain-containing protein n=1 Tax=Vibrio sp. 10N.261.51.F12 TaxID=3229679 RepID=UPI00354B6ED7
MWKLGLVIVILMANIATLRAEPSVCVASENERSQGMILDTQCPIGKGVWGPVDSSLHDEAYWLQCGFLKHEPSQRLLQSIATTVGDNVWLKAETQGHRCLVGPYKQYRDAKRAQAKLRALPGYHDSFLRALAKPIVVQKENHNQYSEPVTVLAATPYMISGEHSRQDCMCLF